MHKRPTLTLRLVTDFATGILRCATALILFGAALSARAQAFEFVALGDLPYGDPAKVGAPYRALIDSINRVQPAFSIHVGDFKSGSTACSNEEFQTQLKHFGLFDAPLIYTPGDNEWTDCHRANNGAHDPLERLAALRSQFFPEGKSLGRLPLAVQSQAGLSPGHSKFVENLRWQHQRVLFATVHIVGSNNNFEVRDAKAVAEFIERDLANVAWIQAAFAQARQSGAQALFLPSMAMCWSPGPSGRISRRIRASESASVKPCCRWRPLPVFPFCSYTATAMCFVSISPLV